MRRLSRPVSDFCPVLYTYSRGEERRGEERRGEERRGEERRGEGVHARVVLRFLNGYHCSGVSRARGAVSLALSLSLGVSDGLAPRWTRPSRALSAPLGPVCCMTAQRSPQARGLAFLIQP
ncbi:hypothetical protein MHYP_G00232450 [Metynnis hypsauchen]